MNRGDIAERHGDSQTVTLVVTMPIKPELEAEFVAAASDFAALVHANEPGVLVYTLNRHTSQEHTYVWVERYRDNEALREHGATSHMAEIRPKFGTWLAAPPEVLRLTQVVPA